MFIIRVHCIARVISVDCCSKHCVVNEVHELFVDKCGSKKQETCSVVVRKEMDD